MSLTDRAKGAGKLVGGLAVAAFLVALAVTETRWTIHTLAAAVHGAVHGISSAARWLTGAAHDTAHDTH